MFHLSRSLNPWREFDEIRREMSQLLAPVGGRPLTRFQFAPAMNVFYNEHEVVLTAELPGINQDDLDLTVNSESVVLKYEAPRPAEPDSTDNGVKYLRRERRQESFQRSISLPFQVNPEGAEAHYENGILTIRIPRPEEQKPRKLEIRSA